MGRDTWFKEDPFFGMRKDDQWIPARTITIWMTPEQHEAFCQTELSAKLVRQYQTEVIALYADNIPYAKGVTFSVSDAEWSEFENTPLFRHLAAYFGEIHPETEWMHTELRGPECKEENQGSTWLFHREKPGQPLLALVCKLFHHSKDA